MKPTRQTKPDDNNTKLTRCLAHSRLGLTNNVASEHRLWNRFVLHFAGMLKARVDNGAQQLGLEQKVLETRRVNAHVMTLFAVARLGRATGSSILVLGGRSDVGDFL